MIGSIEVSLWPLVVFTVFMVTVIAIASYNESRARRDKDSKDEPSQGQTLTRVFIGGDYGIALCPSRLSCSWRIRLLPLQNPYRFRAEEIVCRVVLQENGNEAKNAAWLASGRRRLTLPAQWVAPASFPFSEQAISAIMSIR